MTKTQNETTTMFILCDNLDKDGFPTLKNRFPLCFLTIEEAKMFRQNGEAIIERGGCPTKIAIEVITKTYEFLGKKIETDKFLKMKGN